MENQGTNITAEKPQIISGKYTIQNKVEDFNILPLNLNSQNQKQESPKQEINNSNKIINNRYNDYLPVAGIDFHRRKSALSSFIPKPDAEEIPTFTFENDRNVKLYKGQIYNKSELIEQYSRNYLDYMKKFTDDRRKTPLSTPFKFYEEKNKVNKDYYGYGNISNLKCSQSFNKNKSTTDLNINDINNVNSCKNKNSGFDLNRKDHMNDYLKYNSINNSLDNKGLIFKKKGLGCSFSTNNIFNSRRNEITNPELFYNRRNIEYYKYREEQRKYLDYNYAVMKDNYRGLIHQMKDPCVNPYHPIKNNFETSKSTLIHNPILNPVNNYTYNKYLQKEIERDKETSGGERFQRAGNILVNN